MNTTTSSWKQNRVRANFVLFYWTATWVITFFLADYGQKNWWDSEFLSLVAIAVNALLGVGVLFAHAKQLRSVDELERKVSLDAMAITLGVGFIAGFSYKLLQKGELIAFQAGPTDLLVLMAITLVLSTLIGAWRMR